MWEFYADISKDRESLSWLLFELESKLRRLAYFIETEMQDYDPEDYYGRTAKMMVENIRDIMSDILDDLRRFNSQISSVSEKLEHLKNAQEQLEEFFRQGGEALRRENDEFESRVFRFSTTAGRTEKTEDYQ